LVPLVVAAQPPRNAALSTSAALIFEQARRISATTTSGKPARTARCRQNVPTAALARPRRYATRA
jgi:hypothetical protein